METAAIDHVKSRLKEIIVNSLDVNISTEDIDDQVSLYEDGIGLDSITIVSFIVQIENTFKMSFDESEINAELFSSINSLAGFLTTKV